MALVKYELRQVPQDIVAALWPDMLNPNRTVFPTLAAIKTLREDLVVCNSITT
mgnify:CR=1 FL=1